MFPVVHGAIGAQTSVTVLPAPVRVPSQIPLAPSVTSVANDKGDQILHLRNYSTYLYDNFL